MSFLFGGGSGHKPNASVPSILKGLRVQTSIYGNVVPIVYGTNRVAGNLIWFGDFIAIAHTSTVSAGGKGWGSGQSSTTTTTYTYTGAGAILLCEGPIVGVLDIFHTKGQHRQTKGLDDFNLTPGVTTHQVNVGLGFISDVGVSQVVGYDDDVNDYGDPGGHHHIVGTQYKPFHLVASNPQVGQYSVSAGGLYTFNIADANAGLEVAIRYLYLGGVTIPGMTVFIGNRPQSPWGYLTTKHPGQDLGYTGMAYIANSTFDLGTQGQLQNYNFEVWGLKPLPGGLFDANPSDIVSDLLTNAFYGAGFPASLLGDMTQYSNYCLANGLLLSPVIDSQKTAAQWIQELLDITNSAAVRSQGILKIIPYGDTSAQANGVLFSPNTTPIYDLTDDDFLAPDGDDPISLTIPTVNDAFNNVLVEFLNRANDYNPEIAPAKDEGQVALHGLKPAATIVAHGICDAAVAAKIANTILKRYVYIRRIYKFRTSWKYGLVEPMDLLTLTESSLGYNKLPVRVISANEGEDGEMEFEAEEFPWGNAAPTLYPQQAPTAYIPNDQVDPGNINPPIIFEPPPGIFDDGPPILTNQAIHTGSKYHISFGISGPSVNWGGCEIWWSQDGVNFQRLITHNKRARMGLLTANFAAGSDPETVNTLAVDLGSSLGTLSAGSQADADNGRTLALLQGAGNNKEEIVAFSAATLTGGNAYSMGTYLRRGIGRTAIQAFVTGDNFLRLDKNVGGFDYDPKLVGTPLYFKFLSFNVYGNAVQKLSDVSAYQYTVLGGWGAATLVPGFNALINPGFENNIGLVPLDTAVLGQVSDGWFQTDAFVSVQSPYTEVKLRSVGRNGSRSLQIGTNGVSIPLSNDGNSIISEPFPIKPGDALFASVWYKTDTGSGGAPGGTFLGLNVGIALYKNTNFRDANSLLGLIGSGARDTNGGAFPVGLSGWANLRGASALVPATSAGSVPAYARVVLGISIDNGGGPNPWSPSSASRFLVEFDDAVFVFAPDSSQGFGPGGSVPLSVWPAFNFAAGGVGSTSITISWGATSLRRLDNTIISVGAGSIAITGLVAATQYVFYPYWDEDLQAIHLVGVAPDVGTQTGTAGNGDGAVAYSLVNGAAFQAQRLFWRAPLSNAGMKITTGTGNGTVGGTVQ